MWKGLKTREVAAVEVKWISCGLTESGPIEIQFIRVPREFTVDRRESETKVAKRYRWRKWKIGSHTDV